MDGKSCVIGPLLLLASALLGWPCGASTAADQKSAKPDAFREQCERIESALKEAEKGDDLGLRKAPQMLGRLPVVAEQQDPVAARAQREIKARLWVKSLRIANEQTDPNWDPKETGFLSIPKGTPNLARACEENERIVKRADTQREVRRFVQLSYNDVLGSVRWAFEKTRQSELDKMLKEELPDASLRDKLKRDLLQFDADYEIRGPNGEFDPREESAKR
jgi:hypothetical protein